LGNIFPIDVARPYAVLTGLEGDVLVVLTGTSKPMTGRAVARLVAHGSDRGVRLALNRLAEHGLVDVVEAPPALLYSLNRDHIAAPVAEALVGLRGELRRRLRETISGWPIGPVHASLFGSAARGDGGLESDIDLLIVRPRRVDSEDEGWRAQLDDLAWRVRRWTGNNAGIAEIGEVELPALRRRGPAVLTDLERDAITLVGPHVRELLATDRHR
jgi:predicted nucleotidyltransferase